MSDPDNFLSRWSRRKLEPLQADEEKNAPAARPTETEPQTSTAELQTPPAPDESQKQEPAFDISTLPSLDSITAGTDIRDFLRPGVPLSLSRAALRRAWTSDPAIRDFIEVAENQWDFTNDSIAGFGPLDPAEVPRLLARVIGTPAENERADKADAAQASSPETAPATSGPESVTEPETEKSEPDAVAVENRSQRSIENDAAQKDESAKKLDYSEPRPGHGSALPT